MNELDALAIERNKVAVLHHVCMELSGVIAEYRAMPTTCLEDRMFKTADRYQKRIVDNAPDSTMGLSMHRPNRMERGKPDADGVYVNSGRKLIGILRDAGAPDGQEAKALAAFIYMRDELTNQLYMLQNPGESPQEPKRVAVPDTGSEGQKVVAMVFANGAQVGRARSWLNELLADVMRLHKEVALETSLIGKVS
jgi:hypothetical protein